jgi:hypothetical protein
MTMEEPTMNDHALDKDPAMPQPIIRRERSSSGGGLISDQGRDEARLKIKGTAAPDSQPL